MLRRSTSILLSALVLGSFVVVLSPGVSAGGGCHNNGEMTTGRAEGPLVNIDVEKCGYSPAILYVEPGTDVTWTNLDPVPHTVTGIGLSLHGEDYLQNDKPTRAQRFDDVGVYPYYCILHPGMAGAVVVGDVSAERAAADEVQALPFPAPPDTGGKGTDEGASQDSSSNGMLFGSLLALAVLGLATVLWRRKHQAPEIA